MGEVHWRAQQGQVLAHGYRAPRAPGAPLAVLLHGLSGDERSMWALAHALPSGWGILTPRAPYPAPEGGFSWLEGEPIGWQEVRHFAPAVGALERLLDALPLGAGRPWLLMGFSQGAALALSYRLLGARRPAAWIVAAGYLPRGPWQGLQGMQVFWGHGIHDERIPIARARVEAARLRDAGAQVELCQAPVGHKLGMDCLKGLRGWLPRLKLVPTGRVQARE